MEDIGIDLTSWMCSDIEKYTNHHCGSNVLGIEEVEYVIDGLLDRIHTLEDEKEEMKERDE